MTDLPELCERLRDGANRLRRNCVYEIEAADPMEQAADALEAITKERDALREALAAMLDLQDNATPFGGEMYQDRVDRVFDRARAALDATNPERG